MTELKQKRLWSLAALLTSALLLGVWAQNASAQSRLDRQLVARAESISGDRFQVQGSTPKGVRVFAVARPRAETLRAIDDGFTSLFAVARRHGYRTRLDYSAYTVFIARADRTKDAQGGYSPDLAVPAGQYAGSGYDQGGYIYAAGMVLAYNPSSFIIAEHDGNTQRVSDIVRYEGEHIILYYNDRALYQRTADHSRGGGHPILQ
jgi:peptidoglycan/xylan/chitin deacetylase (PgdA/CDA1 family)